MMNLDYIYMLCFRFFDIEELPKIVHGSMLIFSTLILFVFMKNRFGLFNSYLLSFTFILIPINQKLASQAYVDLGVLCFSTISLVFFIKWIESDNSNIKFFILSAVSSGLSVGTKYTGAIFAIASILFAGIHYSKKRNTKDAVLLMLIYALIIFTVIIPWLIRNYYATANPFYPLLNSIFKPEIIQIENILNVPASEYLTRMLLGESVIDILAIPFRMFLSGRDGDFIGGFDGKFNPLMLLPLFLMALKKNRERILKDNAVKGLIFIMAISFIIFLAYGHLRLRYFIFILPVITILNGYILRSITPDSSVSKIKFNLILLVYFSLFATYNFNYSLDYFEKIDTLDYVLGIETKANYLTRKSDDYKIAQMIEENTEKGSSIYMVMNGNRTYYVRRNYSHDNYILDRMMFKMFYSGSEKKEYLDFLSSLPYSHMKKADYLLINLNGFYHTAQSIFNNLSEDEISQKLTMFNSFIRSQSLVSNSGNTYLFKINYSDI